MKWVSYFFSFILPIYSISAVFDLGLSGFLTWYYVTMGLPRITPRLYLLVWIACMILICMFMYIFINGVAKSHYSAKHNYSIVAFIINQSVATIAYILVAILSKFNGILCFPSVYLAFVINEFNHDIITDTNQEVWMVILMLLHIVTFTAIGIYAYLKERKRLVDKYERTMRTDE